MEQRIQKSEEEKNLFFQNVSHDLKTPLASITGYVRKFPAALLKIIKRQLRLSCLKPANDFSNRKYSCSLTKMDNQNLHLHLTDVDLVEFTDECMESYAGNQHGLFSYSNHSIQMLSVLKLIPIC